jgi:hypothetical protein
MPLGVRGANPIWSEFNLWGRLFDDTYYMWVLQNTIPYIPAIVYQDPDLETEWTNPIQFLGNGTLPDNIYFESDVVYRLEFRQHIGLGSPSQSDPLIYEVDNYVAGSGGSTPVDTIASTSSNQITNPQFALINFISPYTFSGSNPAPIEVAPGWFLNMAGSGSVTITQVPLNNSNANPTNAPYALQLTLSGWTANSVYLSQTFEQNGMLWASNNNITRYVASSITAKLNGPPQEISASLVDSNNDFLGYVLNPGNAIVSQSFNEFTDYLEMPLTINPNIPPAASIQYRLLLPSNIDIYVTSLQLTVSDMPIKPDFIEDSINRQIDHTFNYYNNKLQFKPISSYLVGWEFPLNPKQFGASGSLGSIGANKGAYVWDQTILFQSVNNSVAYSPNTNGDLVITASANTQVALIQYLSAPQIFDMLCRNMSINTTLATNDGSIVTISLWYTTNTTLPSVAAGSNLTFINTLDPNGHPDSVASQWIEIPNAFGQVTFTPGSAINVLSAATKGFSGWKALEVDDAVLAKFFAIVIGTSTINASSAIEINQVSIVPGDIPTIPAPKTLDEVLRQAQYYYEISDPIGAMFLMESTSVYANNQANAFASPFQINYNTVKRAVPNFTVASLASTAGSVSVVLNYALITTHAFTATPAADRTLSSNWATPVIGTKSLYVLPASSNSIQSINGTATGTGLNVYNSASIQFTYILDARLGIV